MMHIIGYFTLSMRAVHVLLISLLTLASASAQTDPENGTIYQPQNFAEGMTPMGVYESHALAEDACSKFMDLVCTAAIVQGHLSDVFANSYLSSLLGGEPRLVKSNGGLNCSHQPVWVSDCTTYTWEVNVDGCGVGYEPDETGRCARECEDGSTRKADGTCEDEEEEAEEQAFPIELEAAMDGLPLCFNEMSALVGNPINYLTGNKVEHEVDYIAHGIQPFTISRTYNSNTGTWTFSTEESIQINYAEGEPNLITTAAITLADGKRITFDYSQTQGMFIQRNLIDGSLTAEHDLGQVVAYIYEDHNRIVRKFVPSGELDRVLYPNGGFHAVTSTAYGSRIEDSVGRFFEVHRNSDEQVTKIRQDGIDVVVYGYNSFKMLDTVDFPDETQIKYLYEDSQRPKLLTGKIGESGYRVSTWAYNSVGLATETLHHKSNGDVINHHTLTYDRENGGQSGRVTEVNPLGKSTTYHYETIAGRRKVFKVEGHASESCLAANQEYEYYSNGLLKSSLDWQGVETYYEYNSRGLTTKVVAAKNTDVEMEINYTWHEIFNAPVEILEEYRKTTFSYDSLGNITTKIVEAR